MKAILVAALFGLASLPALAKDQRVPVEVLSAQSQQHEGVRHVRGSPGTTDTRCHVNGDYAVYDNRAIRGLRPRSQPHGSYCHAQNAGW